MKKRYKLKKERHSWKQTYTDNRDETKIYIDRQADRETNRETDRDKEGKNNEDRWTNGLTNAHEEI